MDRRFRDRVERIRKYREKILEKLRDYFRSRPVAERVWLVGSINTSFFNFEESDIDIAVEGLKVDPFELKLELDMLLMREVDIIEIEDSWVVREWILEGSVRVI